MDHSFNIKDLDRLREFGWCVSLSFCDFKPKHFWAGWVPLLLWCLFMGKKLLEPELDPQSWLWPLHQNHLTAWRCIWRPDRDILHFTEPRREIALLKHAGQISGPSTEPAAPEPVQIQCLGSDSWKMEPLRALDRRTGLLLSISLRSACSCPAALFFLFFYLLQSAINSDLLYALNPIYFVLKHLRSPHTTRCSAALSADGNWQRERKKKHMTFSNLVFSLWFVFTLRFSDWE